MHIRILGTGCNRCTRLEQLVRERAAELRPEAIIEKVTDVMQMLRLGVMSTPSILIDDKPVAVGRVPSREEIDEWLRKE